MRARDFIVEARQYLDFDSLYGKVFKITDNNGNPSNSGFSIVTPLNGASWNWKERPEFKNIVDTNRTTKYNWKKIDVKHDVWSLGFSFLTLYIYRDFYNYYNKYPNYFFLKNGYVSSLIMDVITDNQINKLFTKMMTEECIPISEVCALLKEMM
jgi:hypothetical protein